MSFTKPDWPKHLPNEGVLGLATLGPIGLRMKAPGTWGSAAGVLFVVCFFPLSLVENLLQAWCSAILRLASAARPRSGWESATRGRSSWMSSWRCPSASWGGR